MAKRGAWGEMRLNVKGVLFPYKSFLVLASEYWVNAVSAHHKGEMFYPRRADGQERTKNENKDDFPHTILYNRLLPCFI